MFDPEKGEEVYEYTHRIMKKLLTPEVASGYNLTGRNSKKKFQDLELYKVVVGKLLQQLIHQCLILLPFL